MNVGLDEQRTMERRRARMEAKQRIQGLYALVSQDFQGRSSQWLQMADELEAYAAPAVWAVLKKSPCANRSSFETVAGNAREALYGEKIFEGYRRMLEKTPECMFADYCRGIYRHKALDYIREVLERQKLEGDLQEGVLAAADSVFPDSEPDAGERFVKYYVDAAMNAHANPFHMIFLCYSKILPVILAQTNCTSADKWAWAHMKGKTLRVLSEDFVMIFNSTARIVRTALSEAYRQKLETPYINCHGETVTLGQAVLTDEFTQSYTKNWVARLNARVIRDAAGHIAKSGDEELIALVMNYTQGKYGI